MMMKMKMGSKNKMRGIGLLELMLSLAIIAILLVMATRYFIAANESQKINNAISQVHGIAGGAANYALTHPGYKDMSIDTLISGNFIPKSFGGSDGKGTGANPWNGNLSVALATPGYTVTLTALTSTICTKLADTINGKPTATGDSAQCSSNQVTVNFP